VIGRVRYPRRPAWLHREGHTLQTKHGTFTVIVFGVAGDVRKRWWMPPQPEVRR
jgi:hypothetical protein